VTINYDGRTFRAVSNTENGETSADTIFSYRQEGSILSADYSGGAIVIGHMLGLVDEDGSLDFRYHQINQHNEIMTGMCRSVPEVLPDGRIRLHESWQWTSGEGSSGTSIVEEIVAESPQPLP
jgi:hypothetical protein